ncbi:hypothetical protein [Micromonospora ureilytica]|uniref:hypothetical protein n=1 Tax=Micromonospora ureilytica TaxID=709868 RepID=UPI002E12163E|nr:hypothetical protein OHB55_30465 [Micromonospora ureilytica]
MERELAAALEPIFSDLGKPGGVQPDLRDEPWRDDPQTASAFLYASDGSGHGISIYLGLSAVTQIVTLADQVQDWAVEALWSLGRATNWPPCPQHPNSHPLAAVVHADRAVWACPTAGTDISEIGTLGS